MNCTCSAVLVAAVVIAGNGCGGETPPPAEAPPAPSPAAIIVAPVNGDSVAATFDVQLDARGVEVVPADGQRVAGQGHHHLFIDADVTPSDQPIPAGVPTVVHLGTGVSTWSAAGLSAGTHRIIAVLAYGDHTPMEGVATDTVVVTVRGR